jgi:hypothetical protein
MRGMVPLKFYQNNVLKAADDTAIFGLIGASGDIDKFNTRVLSSLFQKSTQMTSN